MKHPLELVRLVEFEGKIKRVVIQSDVEIEIRGDVEKFKFLGVCDVIITTGNVSYVKKLDDQFFAQVIKRVRDKEKVSTESKTISVRYDYSLLDLTWKESSAFIEELLRLRVYLHYSLTTSPKSFIAKIREALKGLVILFDNSSTTKNEIYGIVSAKFTTSDQLAFRKSFIDNCGKNDGLIDTVNTHIIEREGRVVEFFPFKSEQDDEIELTCALTYGKNNGYASYYVVWIRKLKETKSYLSPFESFHKYNWKNNPMIINSSGGSLNDFVNFIAEEGAKFQELNRNLSNRSKSELIAAAELFQVFNNILDKAKVADASKVRCLDQFREMNKTHSKSYSVWAVGESIAFVSTHNKYVPKSMQLVLRKLSTSLLELGVERLNEKFGKEDFNITLRVR
jgi:hypothetical protein